jgi:hypothetical protein
LYEQVPRPELEEYVPLLHHDPADADVAGINVAVNATTIETTSFFIGSSFCCDYGTTRIAQRTNHLRFAISEFPCNFNNLSANLGATV